MNVFRNKHTGIFSATVLWNIVLAMTLMVYAAGLFIPIMEPDAAVYAQVSMEMHDRGDYLSIYHKGADWLDKPHFPFWMSAFSYEIFGVNTLAYKLPAILFILLGAFYTYLFAKKFYSSLHGWIAIIKLITAEHIIISNQDVRAEPFMTGLLIMGLYHFASVLTTTGTVTSSRWFAHLVLASFASACLIMTKGLFTIIPIASGIGLALIYQKRFKAIFHWQWLMVIFFTLLFLTPSLYGYYQQFDQHPEKTVFGEKNVSGVEFFLWTSQWGRFTNTGPIKGKGDITFFIHTLLWAFLPWAFAAFYSLFQKIRQLVKGVTIGENYTFFGFITLFLIFSASGFQLSFYLNPLFPLLAIITTAAMINASRKVLRVFSVIHLVLSVLLIIGVILLHNFFTSALPALDTWLVLIGGVTIAFYIFICSRSFIKKIIFATALVVVSVNYYLNREFYPELLDYQAESEAAYFIKKNNIPAKEVVFAGEMESVADVILHHTVRVIATDSIQTNNIAEKYVFTTDEGRRRIDSLGLQYQLIREFEDFPVTRLTGKFINQKTRKEEVKRKYLLRVAGFNRGP